MGLVVQIGADVQQAQDALKKFVSTLNIVSIGAEKVGLSFKNLSEKVAFFGGGVNKFVSPLAAQFEKLHRVINNTPQVLNKLTTSTNAANFALINTGRVLQDLPFGFIGIQNNLNPLLESFQRLRAESGSSSLALKALGKSLIGGGGIGFALSLVSSAVLLFTNGFQSFSRKTQKAKEDAESFTKTLEELSHTSIDIGISSIGSTSEELSKVNALSNAVLNQTLSYKERNNALNQLKDINKNYFGDLTLEADKLATLKGRVEEYTSAIIAAATVKAFSEDIGKLNVEFAKQLIAFNKNANALDKFKNVLANTKETYTSLTGEERVGSAAHADAARNVNKASGEYKKQIGVLDDLKTKQIELRGALQQAVNESLKFKPLTIDTPKGGSIESEIDKIIAEGKRLAAAFGDIAKVHLSVLPEFTELDTKGEEFAKAKEIIKKIKDHAFKFGTKSDVLKLIIPVKPEPVVFPPEQAVLNRTNEEITEIIKSVRLDPIEIQSTITPTFSLNLKSFEEASKKLASLNLGKNFILPSIDLEGNIQKNKQLLGSYVSLAEGVKGAINEINTAIANIAVEGIATFGEALGTALAGGDLQKGFQNFANIVADGFTSIGKKMIAASPIIAALRAAIKTLNPLILLPAGIALVAIGAALRTSIRGVKGFEKGGRPPVGVPSLVGEKGKELFIPDSSKPSIIGKHGPELFRPTVPGTIISNKNLTQYVKNLNNTFTKNSTLSTNQFLQPPKNIVHAVNTFFKNVSSFKEVFTDKEKVVQNNAINNEVSKLFTVLKSDSKLKERFNDISKIFSSKEFSKENTVTFIKDRLNQLSEILKSVFVTKESKLLQNLQVVKLPGFANGGRPAVGRPSFVGEKGKEIFIPDRPGTIIPNNKINEFINNDSHFSEAINNINNVFNKNGVVNNVFNSDKLITNIFNSKEVNREVSKLIQVLKSESKLSKIFSSVFKEIPGFVSGGRPLVNKQSLGGEKGKEIWIPDVINNQLTKSFEKQSVLTDKITIIGSNGPEIFKPTVPGIIIPNNKIGQAMNSIKNYFSNKSFSNSKSVSSFSSPLTKIFNSTIMKRESGGSVFAGIPFLGGEGGREIFFPASQRLNPNNNLSSIQGSAMQMIKVEVNGRLDGRDIVLSGARTNRSQGRNF